MKKKLTLILIVLFTIGLTYSIISIKEFSYKKEKQQFSEAYQIEKNKPCIPLLKDLKAGKIQKVLKNPYKLLDEQFCDCLTNESLKKQTNGSADWVLAKIFHADNDLENLSREHLATSLRLHYFPAIRLAINLFIKEKRFTEAYEWFLLIKEKDKSSVSYEEILLKNISQEKRNSIKNNKIYYSKPTEMENLPYKPFFYDSMCSCAYKKYKAKNY